MIDHILFLGQYSGFQLVLLIDLHQILTFLIEFTIIAIFTHRLARRSANPPKTYALLSIVAVGVFAANIPSFLIFLTFQFNRDLLYLIVPVSIVLEFLLLLVLFLILGILSQDRRRVGVGVLFFSVLVGNLISYGAFWALTLIL